MAMLKKLSVQGVRSFNPDDSKKQWIEFGSPLTLILGINGSGKTTIIEALKFAITNQFPPNSSKGASFVNDPKLTYNDSALAKVVLELEDTSGNRYTTTRKVKTTIKNKKGDLSTSQLEGTLRIVGSKGEKQLTTKCQDIKVEVCRIMGVSEAILNHVIFCHQEESCWPLDEGKKVKETFDAIFNTTAYKKCFDRLTSVDKEIGINLKVEEEGLIHVKENRLRAKRFREQLENKKILFQSQNDAIAEYEKEIAALEVKLRRFQELEKEYVEKQTEMVAKKTKVESTTKQIEELRKIIKEEYRGSLSDLKIHLDNFAKECLEKKKLVKEHENTCLKYDRELTKHNADRGRLLKEEGMLQQEENANKKRLEELETLMKGVVLKMRKLNKGEISDEALSTSFSNSLDVCISESEALSFDAVNKALTTAIRIKDFALKNAKKTFDDEERELQSAINEVRAKMASMEKEKVMKAQELKTAKKNFQETKERLKLLDGSNEKLQLLEDDEERYKEQIESIETSGFMMKCDSEIKSLAKEVKELESGLAKATETFGLLNSDKSKTDNIALLNRQKLQKQNDCNELMRKMEDDVKQLLGEVPEKGLGSAIESKSKSLKVELRSKRDELKKNEKEVASVKSGIKYTEEDLKKKEAKLKDCKDRIMDVLIDKDFDTAYNDVNDKLDEAAQDCYFANSASYLYKKYIARLSKKDCCPLCKRDFEAREMAKKLTSEIEAEITRMQQSLPRLKENQERLKKQQQDVLDIKPVWDEMQSLSEESIPKLKSRLEELQAKDSNLMDENDNISMTVTVIETDVATVDKCRPNIAILERCKSELKKLEDEIAKIERTRNPAAKVCTTTLTDAETEMEELNRKIQNKRSEKESKEEMRNKKRDELAKLQEKKNKVKEEKLKITAELQNREGLDQRRKELEVSIKELEVKIDKLTEELPAVKTEISAAEKNKSACIQRRETSLHELREEKAELEKQKQNITDKNRHIQDFEKKKDRFAEIQQRVAECKEKISELEQKKSEKSKIIDDLKEEVVGQELKERELKDNVALKEKLELLSKYKVELKEKEAALSLAENREVAKDRRKVQDKYRSVEAKLNEIKGQKIETKNSIKKLEEELGYDEIANAESEYILKYAKKITFEKAQKDVRRYKTALDMAIMQFHKKRMEKINKILLEYWRRIYKGNDIDKIMIKTEADEQAAKSNKVKVTAASVRKSYNYRVVMVRKGGVEIDMRGRCSAGQRVLASIIIRIALAESFGSRCGIITLDEPTTNLDQKNINSLSNALADLAEKMSQRKNFQLIVITHDQDFTDRLTGIDAVEKYWKVDRDAEGFSRIKMIPKRGYSQG